MTRLSLPSDRRRGRGQTLVEFAMVLPVIMLILLGLLDLGRVVYSYNTLTQAARQGARTAIVNQNVTNVRNATIAAAPTLGLNSTNVDVCFKASDSVLGDCTSSTDNCPPLTRVIGCLAVVKTHFSYAPMTPVVSLIWSSFSLSSTSVASVEYVCPEYPATACP